MKLYRFVHRTHRGDSPYWGWSASAGCVMATSETEARAKVSDRFYDDDDGEHSLEIQECDDDVVFDDE